MLSKELNRVISELVKAGIELPRLEASVMIEASKNENELNAFIEERKKGKPLCKIIGRKDFYKHSFIVNEDVLSPRPDTEILLEAAINIMKKEKITKVLEFGVGSGCLILSILKELKSTFGVGVDISFKAIDIAIKNASNLGVSERVSFINSSWFDENVIDKINSKFDIIISNPPYIPSEDIKTLDIAVKKYDPMLALDGGSDGLKDYRRISKISLDLLHKDGYVLLEIGIGQKDSVVDIFINNGFSLVDVIKDLSGIDRCIIFKK